LLYICEIVVIDCSIRVVNNSIRASPSSACTGKGDDISSSSQLILVSTMKFTRLLFKTILFSIKMHMHACSTKVYVQVCELLDTVSS